MMMLHSETERDEELAAIKRSALEALGGGARAEQGQGQRGAPGRGGGHVPPRRPGAHAEGGGAGGVME